MGPRACSSGSSRRSYWPGCRSGRTFRVWTMSCCSRLPSTTRAPRSTVSSRRCMTAEAVPAVPSSLEAAPRTATHPLANGRPEPLLSELSRAGRPGHQLPELDVPQPDDLDPRLLRATLPLPELGELDVIRHF